jgi:hypothetical protein
MHPDDVSCGPYYRSFTIVTYDHNNSSLYYKTLLLAKALLILANLALAKSVNYDHRVRFKIKRALQLELTTVKIL